jgi:hypothetical protein
VSEFHDLRAALGNSARDYICIPGTRRNDPSTPWNVLAFCVRRHHHGSQGVLLADGTTRMFEDRRYLQKLVLDTMTQNNISIDLSEEATKEEAAACEDAVERLGSEDFDTREAASQVLTAAGFKASKSLRAGAKADDLECSSRCKAMLARLRAQRDWIEALRREAGLDDNPK